ncbi:hypothetical protein [Desmospora activa]|uniref:Uncharacterized protein n=1 Tax=Desmospora activa DSM 45169 TaxID=1121389 RepID=A0A2T4ZDQ4_9BACL|nr:hypothetical protein [Desmospora activa]PTM60031.1 hypothetical protein C8J48_2670 [Desmospora activa DSM 45169]
MTFNDQGEQNSHQPETLIPLKEAARILRISEEEVRILVSEHRLSAFEKEDGKLWFSEEAIARILNSDESRTTTHNLTVLETGEREHSEQEARDSAGSWKNAFAKITAQFRALRQKKPLSNLKWREWMERFFKVVEKKKQKEVKVEQEQRQVSVKLGFMTGQNELYCDFCEVHDRFYPGAIFADIYVDGALKWMMCPNCLQYCRDHANGSIESNIRARFNQLAFRLEREARRARNLATSEDFRAPSMHEWEAWENASFAMQEVASTYWQEPPSPEQEYRER